MDIYKDKWTVLEQQVFSLMCVRAGERLSQREIAQSLGVSPTAVASAVRKLAGYVRVERTKNINFVSLDRESAKTIALKRVENLKNVYQSGLLDYLEDELPGGTIVLFGSYSRGEDALSSDIDIAVIGRKDKLLRLEPHEKALHRKINVSFYERWSSIHKHLRNNILSGILLAGSVE